ncbi:hypothetical protein [Halobaculum lipolyticum]|uniref:Tat (Twin-arginine translocation) pathway signal sequence n=1 Tax=Halobaculum lipolyticum TaxID=3032001 RepID=A0ABD5W724_9EURY|nr:hypothetical protein [Halobaculum sp. DT31]
MNRRRFLAGVGAAAAGVAGYGGVRVADLRPYEPAPPAADLDDSATPRERVLAATRHLFAADHRAVTRVTVLDDWTGEAPYRLTRHRELHEHSRRRHTHALTTFGNGMVLADRERDGVDPRAASPYATIDALLHFSDATLADPETLPERFVLHVDDGALAYDRDAPPQSVGEPVTVDGGAAGVGAVNDYPRPMFGEPIRPHRAPWREHDRSEETVTYELSGADAYARAVPLYTTAGVEIREASRLRATLDRETGRLRRVVDRRAIDANVGVDERDVRSVAMRRETTFDRYGRATAPRPRGSFGDGLGVGERVAALFNDLSAY